MYSPRDKWKLSQNTKSILEQEGPLSAAYHCFLNGDEINELAKSNVRGHCGGCEKVRAPS
jgi:hypothetical protein